MPVIRHILGTEQAQNKKVSLNSFIIFYYQEVHGDIGRAHPPEGWT